MRKPPAAPISTAKGVRLQKAMADAGLGARRDCEDMITAGRVKVNGRVVDTLPCFVDPASDVVELDDEVVELPVPEQSTADSAKAGGKARTLIYVLINKPKGVITTTSDPEGRRNVLELVPTSLRREERLFPVGRLDGDSTGLLLITNDGDLAYQLTHPKFGIPKEYRVLTSGLASDEQLQKLRAGMYLVNPTADGSKTSKRASMESVRIIKRFVDRARGDRTLLSVTLREGQNREIRRMLARVGLKVRELERVAIGPLRAGDLKPGQAKLLGKKDVEKLRAATLSAGLD
ncbi:rRNA pseudouridine synthase [Steroidobacter sp. S1-65]|uniref:Pseudouridine synthase n=1 Tax=Steroidobacter gossypii TaxID=2805490 RepID=A0ABS1WRK2_9GAMM|nr:pseudouridine synthase [Steroidobacter gossypii]MBM0103602.1 rRNA pseudouridine synthase [Steroidobacter gossypii]